MKGQDSPQPPLHEARAAAAERVLRGGEICRIEDAGGDCLVTAVDVVGRGAWLRWLATSPGPRLVLSGTRARAVGIAIGGQACAAVRLAGQSTPALVEMLVGGSGMPWPTAPLAVAQATPAETAGVELAKRAGLLPAVLSLPSPQLGIEPMLAVDASAIVDQPRLDLTTLEATVEARLPIASAENARLVAFRSHAAPLEHLALLIGQPESAAAPLCRLHSECLTGDVLGSLRCDCGQQLQGAVERMARGGHGVLLYLRQEGRGIGLVNKLRAYRLQEQGLDTLDANMHLGFQPDERDFAAAAAMLRKLGIGSVRLLTNNPEKIEALARHGIEIVERVPLVFAANRHNRPYLETKAVRSGHWLRAIDGGRMLTG
jgi:GTP cyclohydrolase II